MLLISEDLDEVLTLADRIAVMYEGAIVGEVDARSRDGRGDRPADGRRTRTEPREATREPRGPHREAPRAAALADGRRPARLARRRASSRSRSCSLATGHPPSTTLRRLFDAAYLADGALTNTLIAATPLAFTGLAAAVAFRMRLFNIGAEGQLYFGAIGAAGHGAAPRRAVDAGADRRRWCVGGAVLGAAWGAIPGLLRAFLRTNEIITSLMLNYVAALFLNYLIFDSLSYWRDTSATGARLPAGQGARRTRRAGR